MRSQVASAAMLSALQRLRRRLQAVAEHPQQLRHCLMADRIVLLAQGLGKMACALRGPAQRRHRVASRVRINEPLQSLKHGRRHFRNPLAATAHFAYLAGRQRLPMQFLQTLVNRWPLKPGCACHGRHPAVTEMLGIRSRNESSLTLVQMLRFASRHRPRLEHRCDVVLSVAVTPPQPRKRPHLIVNHHPGFDPCLSGCLPIR